MKLTPWFDGDEKPARTGLYQRMAPAREAITYAYYAHSVGKWFLGDPKAEVADKSVTHSWWQKLPWRGIEK